MRKIKDLKELINIDISNINQIECNGIYYKKIFLSGEPQNVHFYSEIERHLISINYPKFVNASYCILEKNPIDKSYKRVSIN